MARYFAALALLGAVLADGGSHPSAPAAGYGAPTGGYEQPSYDAPASYEQPIIYDTYAEPSATGYDASYDQQFAADTVDGFDLSKLLELLPLFIAVFAAIILAQLLAPLFGVLFDAKVGLLGNILNPFGQIKLDVINALLNPLGYAIGNFPPTANAVFPTMGRSFSSEDFGIIDAISIAEKIYGGMNDIIRMIIN